MRSETKIIDTIKQAAIEAWKAEQPVELRFGTVISADPIKIKLNDKLTLTKEFVSLYGSVKDGDKVSLLRIQGGQHYLVLGDRTETITGTVTQTVGGIVSNDEGKNSTVRNRVCAYAKSKLGCRYVYGAAGEDTFDCSGLTYWAYKKIGMTIPRSSSAQYAAATKVSKANLKMGDLVFFKGTTGRSGITHVGMYAGNGMFIHAPHTGDVVRHEKLSSSYYTAHWAGGGRFIKD